MRLEKGDIVKHFKRESCSQDILKSEPNIGLYKILDIGVNASTGNRVVIYKALYKVNEDEIVWVRDYEEFYSEVDKDKYPNVKQRYCFEKCEIPILIRE